MFQLPLLHILDLTSTVGFAASGMLLAREQRRGFLPALGYALLTAVGGGTLRDLLLGQPVFWTQAPIYLLLALTTGMSVFLFSKMSRLCRCHVGWLDNVGLATFSVIGTQVGLLKVAAVLPLGPVLGLMTAMGGGCLRDVLSHQRPSAFKRPRAVLASLAGGGVYSLLAEYQLSPCFVGVIAIATTLLLLPGSIRYLLRLTCIVSGFSRAARSR